MVIKKRGEVEYFHICITEDSPLVKKLKMAKVTLDCSTYEELIERLWHIATKIEIRIGDVERNYIHNKLKGDGRGWKK